MKKSTLLFVLVLITMVCKNAQAQETIITDISEEYLSKLVSIAEANYPLVKSNKSKIDLAQDNVGKAKIGYLNSLTFSYIYQPQGINTVASTGNNTANYSYFNGIQAGIYFNLGSFLAVPYAVKQAKHEVDIARDDQGTYLLTLTNLIRTRYYTYVGDIAILKYATQAAVDAENLSNSVKNKFEKGEETYDDYTKSQSSMTTSYQSKIQAETALLIAKANLEELLGEKLENVK